MIQNFVKVIYMTMIILTVSTFMSPVLWCIWNKLLIETFTQLPHLRMIDADGIIFLIQFIRFFMPRQVAVQYVPIATASPQTETTE